MVRPVCQVLDVGCGIGGPLREIVSFSGASVVGLNNNSYQIKRGQVWTPPSFHFRHNHLS